MKHLVAQSKLQAIAKAVMDLVGCTEAEYMDCLKKQGAKLLKRLVVDKQQYEIMINSNAYWVWFTNHFIIIDKEVLDLGAVPDAVEYLYYNSEGVFKWNLFHYWLVRHDSNKMNVVPCKLVIEAAEDEWIKAKVKKYAAQ
jgi:hypothetical protein